MSDTTISWTEKSWNPIAAFDRETGKRGWFCVHASEGCMNCYAEARNRWIGNRHRYRAQDAKNKADLVVFQAAQAALKEHEEPAETTE